FEERLATLFDYLADGDIVIRDAGTAQAAEQRSDALTDYHDNRIQGLNAKRSSYRPLAPDRLYLTRDEWAERVAATPAHLTSPFHLPEDTGGAVDFLAAPARDFAPERAAQDNVYAAVKTHVDALRRDRSRVILASYTA